jgi:hypothetical protein
MYQRSSEIWQTNDYVSAPNNARSKIIYAFAETVWNDVFSCKFPVTIGVKQNWCCQSDCYVRIISRYSSRAVDSCHNSPFSVCASPHVEYANDL